MEDQVEHTEALADQSPGIKQLLTNRNFFALFFGGFISDMGSFFAYIAILFLGLSLNNDKSEIEAAQALALILIFMLLPSIFIGPIAGVFVDRFDRKKLMILADVFGSLVAFGFIFVQQINHIYLLVFLSSFSRLFFYPSREAVIPLTVDPENLMQANGVIQTTSQLSRIIGPAMAGTLIALFGFKVAFIFDAVSFLISAIFILTINIDLKPKVKGKLGIKQVISDLKQGLSTSLNDRILSYLMISLSVTMLIVGLMDPLFPSYLKFYYGLDEGDYGKILGFSGLFGLAAGIILTSKRDIEKKLTVLGFVIILAGVAVAVIGLSYYLPNPIIGLYAGMAIFSIVGVTFMIPFSTVMQSIVKNENLGRVSAIMSTSMVVSQTLGAFISTQMLKTYQIHVIYAIVAVLLIYIGIVSVLVISATGLETNYNRRAIEMKIERKKLKAQKLEAAMMDEQLSLDTENEIPSMGSKTELPLVDDSSLVTTLAD